MTRERLHMLADLILDCVSWGYENSTQIIIAHDGDHRIYVYPDIGTGNTHATTYYCSDKQMRSAPTGYVYDPDLVTAEAHIRRIIKRREKQ